MKSTERIGGDGLFIPEYIFPVSNLLPKVRPHWALVTEGTKDDEYPHVKDRKSFKKNRNSLEKYVEPGWVLVNLHEGKRKGTTEVYENHSQDHGRRSGLGPQLDQYGEHTR